MKAPRLDKLLAGYPAGTWVVLNPRMSKVMGSARTPDAAMRKARVAPVASSRAVGKRPVLFQIPPAVLL